MNIKEFIKYSKDSKNNIVIHIKSMEERDSLIEALSEILCEVKSYLEYQSEDLIRWLMNTSSTTGCNTCYKIDNSAFISTIECFPSVIYWKCFKEDVYEICDGIVCASKDIYSNDQLVREKELIFKYATNRLVRDKVMEYYEHIYSDICAS